MPDTTFADAAATDTDNEPYWNEDDVAPYPSNVLGIINGVAWVGLILGLIFGAVAMIHGATAHTSTGLSGTTSSADNTTAVIVGMVAIIGSAVQWAFFRAVALVVEYLWRIQLNTAP